MTASSLSLNTVLTLLVFAVLYTVIGRRLMGGRDFLLVTGAATTIGFLSAGVFYSWALVVGLGCLIASSFYLAFVYRNPRGVPAADAYHRVMRRRVLTAFVMGIALVIFVVVAIDQSRRNVIALSRYIDVYEPHSSLEWVPRVESGAIGRWMLTTNDPPASVLGYYKDFAAREGWQITSFSPPNFASMQRNGIKLTLMLSESSREGTSVVIALTNTAE